MAERRYSPDDQQKMMRDFMADARAKGADFQQAHVTSPDGITGAIKEMKHDMGYTVAQSQVWTAYNDEHIKNKKKDKS